MTSSRIPLPNSNRSIPSCRVWCPPFPPLDLQQRREELGSIKMMHRSRVTTATQQNSSTMTLAHKHHPHSSLAAHPSHRPYPRRRIIPKRRRSTKNVCARYLRTSKTCSLQTDKWRRKKAIYRPSSHT